MPKALIVGCAGTRLDAPERSFLQTADPLGFILFARNISTPDQVRALVADMRACIGRPGAPVLIDQEGGPVARLGPPHWRAAAAAADFGKRAHGDADAARRAVYLNARLIGAELAALGITVDCAPVADLPVAGADPIIGERAFALDPETVTALATAFYEGLTAAGVLPVIKHIPGHGRAGVDSHKVLPRVGATRAELAAWDFVPFASLARLKAPEPWAMTAHVIYEAFDETRPATLSPLVMREVVRGAIGFDGIDISDDLSMGALEGPFEERATRALAAGCDLVLHCNGNLDEMRAVAAGTGKVGAGTEARLARSLGARAADGTDFNAEAARDELATLMAPITGEKT